MQKSRTFQVTERIILFQCPSCRARKRIAVASDRRRKTVCCQKCGSKTFCNLNRRQDPRTNQSGLVLMMVGSNTTEVNLLDISINGAGIEMKLRSRAKVAVGNEVHLKCSWNPLLFSQKGYVIKSIRGIKIGMERRD